MKNHDSEPSDQIKPRQWTGAGPLQRHLDEKPRFQGIVVSHLARFGRLCPQLGEDLQVVLAGVSAAHGLEDRVGTRLHRQVQVRAQLRNLSVGADQVAAHEDRVRTREAHALDPRHRSDAPEQFGELQSVRRYDVNAFSASVSRL